MWCSVCQQLIYSTLNANWFDGISSANDERKSVQKISWNDFTSTTRQLSCNFTYSLCCHTARHTQTHTHNGYVLDFMTPSCRHFVILWSLNVPNGLFSFLFHFFFSSTQANICMLRLFATILSLFHQNFITIYARLEEAEIEIERTENPSPIFCLFISFSAFMIEIGLLCLMLEWFSFRFCFLDVFFVFLHRPEWAYQWAERRESKKKQRKL